MIFKESHFCGKTPALPHDFKPGTQVCGGNLSWEPPFVCWPKPLRLSGPFCTYCCLLFKRFTSAMLPSCSPQGGQVAETPVQAEPARPGAPSPPHRWLVTRGDPSFERAFCPLSAQFPRSARGDFLLTYPPNSFHRGTRRFLKTFTLGTVFRQL